MGSSGWMGSLARWLGRGGSGALCILIAGGVAWGVFNQPEPVDPFAERSFASLDWWLLPSAHPALAQLPVRPVGRTLLPRVFMADWRPPPDEGASIPPDAGWIDWSPTAPAAIVFADGRRHPIRTVQFSPDALRGWAFVDGRRLFATEDSGRTWTEKIRTERWISTAPSLEEHKGNVLSVAFNWAGDRIVSGSVDGTVRLLTFYDKPAADPF